MKPILPGSTIGVLGSGQLGRMFAIAARRMGYRVHTYSPDSDTPTGQIADLEITAQYEDLDAVRRFASGVEVLTFEFENVPAATAQAAAECAPVRPDGSVLHIAQHRLREKTYLRDHGFPVTRFAEVRSAEQADAAAAQFNGKGILKSAGFGYDGKGQVRLSGTVSGADAWALLGVDEAVLEELVDFKAEYSVIGVRSDDGRFVHYGPVENRHRNGILDVTVVPDALQLRVVQNAVETTRAVLESLEVVGVLCVEFFLTRSGKLLINELAPRPHNSGHYTIDACHTSQFEQQLRAVCGLPLGAPDLLRPAAMANLLGDLWSDEEPDWAAVLENPAAKLHLYGKIEPRPGRKMGHITALGPDSQSAVKSALAARSALARQPSPRAF